MAKRIKAESKPIDGNLPDAKTLKEHLGEYGRLDSQIAERRGQIGALVKAGEADRNIHRAASKLAMKLAKMDEAKKAEFLRHFDHYRATLKLDEQMDFFADAPEIAPANSVNGAAKSKRARAPQARAPKATPARITGKDAASGARDDDDFALGALKH